MKTLLVINSSARLDRSITRHLTNRFAAAWQDRLPDGRIIHRDVGLNPPFPVTAEWITAAFSKRVTSENMRALAESEVLIDEIAGADALVIGAPMYNFGVPASLKAYIDQIVRVGRTFAFNAEGAEPYIPLLSAKPVVLITSTGAGGYEPGGPFAHLNQVEPHLKAVLEFIGLKEIHFVRVCFEEFQDERLRLAIAAAENKVDALVAELLGRAEAVEA